jgi:hypothetical protein
MSDRNPAAADPLTIAMIALGVIFIPSILIGLVAH